MVWQPLRDLVARNTDMSRPLRLAEVLNTDEWSATGPSFVQVLVGGDSRRAIYRDGPEPEVGSYLQVVRMSADAASMYLALPLPDVICPDTDFAFLTTAQALGSGAWRVLHCHVVNGRATWTDRAACPGSGDYRPLWSQFDFLAGTTRYFTYSPGDALYYSDDAGATWTTASGTAGIAYISTAAIGSNTEAQYGGAVTAGGFIETFDRGASWAAVPNSAPPSGSWRFGGTLYYGPTDTEEPTGTVPVATWGLQTALYWGVTDTGIYLSLNRFAHYFYPDAAPMQPFADPDRGWQDPGSDIGFVADGLPHFPLPPHAPGEHVITATRPNIYGYQPVSVGAGRHAFLAEYTGFTGINVLVQPGDSTTSAESGMEPSGRAFYQTSADGLTTDWVTSGGAIAAGSAPGLLAVHEAKGGETELMGTVLIADKESGEGYALRNWGLRNVSDNWTYLYQGPGNHPTGKTGIGTRAAGFTLDCIVVALSESDGTAPTYALHPYVVTTHPYTGSQADPPNTVAGRYRDLSAAQVAQLGGRYRASYGGLVVIE